MTKEKKIQLTKYLNDLKNKLSDKTIPKKHEHRVESYHNFLKHEIKIVESTLEKDRLENLQAKV